MRSPIRVRLALWYTMVLAFTLAATGVGVYLLLSRSLRQSAELHLRDDIAAFGALVAHEAEEEPGWSANQILAGAAREATLLGWRVAVYDTAGNPVVPFARTQHERMDEAVRGGVAGTAELIGQDAAERFATIGDGVDGLRLLAVPVEARGVPFTAVVVRPSLGEHEVLEQLRTTFAVLLPLVLLLTGVAGYFLSRRSLAPMAGMAREAERIGARTLGARLPTGNPHDEVGALARVFNDLLGRLEEAFTRQQRFMADASHELRTPAAIIRGEAEVALSRTDRPSAEYRSSLAVVHGEAERLARIVDDLFTLSRADSGQHPLIPEELYLDELLAECCRSFRSVAAGRGVALVWEAEVEAPFRGDPALLRRLLLNLLDNATRHTPSGGVVRLTLDSAEGAFRIAVADTGPGVPADAATHIFERFFRADAARSRDAERNGAGLGLAIARWIAEAHQGSLDLLRTGPDGTIFRILLPHPLPPPSTG